MHVVSVRSHSPDGTTQEVPRVPHRMVESCTGKTSPVLRKYQVKQKLHFARGTVEAPQTVKLVKGVPLMRTNFTRKAAHIIVPVASWCYAQACRCSQFRAPPLGLVTKAMDSVVVGSAFDGA